MSGLYGCEISHSTIGEFRVNKHSIVVFGIGILRYLGHSHVVLLPHHVRVQHLVQFEVACQQINTPRCVPSCSTTFITRLASSGHCILYFSRSGWQRSLLETCPPAFQGPKEPALGPIAAS